MRRQEADGSWGGIQPPWVYSLIALHLSGYPLDHAVMRRGLEGLERFMVEDRDDAHGVGAPAGESRRLEACQSPVWDTALSMVALSDAGIAADHPAMLSAADWLLKEEVTRSGDWAVARPDLEPGGWAFEFANANYPDVDDTAEVVLALERVRHPERARANDGEGRGARRAIEGALACAVGRGHAVRRRRLGRVRCGEHALARARAAVPGLRRGDRRAERGRHGPRAGDARGARTGERPRGAARCGVADRSPGKRRIVVRALGCQPRLRHGRGRARR